MTLDRRSTMTLAFAAALFGLVNGFFGVAAFGAMQHQCPSGADCPDARQITYMGLGIFVICVGVVLWAVRKLRRGDFKE